MPQKTTYGLLYITKRAASIFKLFRIEATYKSSFQANLEIVLRTLSLLHKLPFVCHFIACKMLSCSLCCLIGRQECGDSEHWHWHQRDQGIYQRRLHTCIPCVSHLTALSPDFLIY